MFLAGNIALFVMYVLVSSVGLYQIKLSGNNLHHTKFYLGLLLYGLGFILWLVILKQNKLSVAFPIAASSLIIATQFFGFLLGEGFSIIKLLAVVITITGICLFYVSSGK